LLVVDGWYNFGTAKFLKEQNWISRFLGLMLLAGIEKYHETREFDNDEIYPIERRLVKT
jgi:hypothetical protein